MNLSKLTKGSHRRFSDDDSDEVAVVGRLERGRHKKRERLIQITVISLYQPTSTVVISMCSGSGSDGERCLAVVVHF